MTGWRAVLVGARRMAVAALVSGTLVAPAATAPAPTTGTPGPTVPVADLQSDLALLRHAYEALHPGLYRHRSKAQMDAAFEALGREFARERTLGEAYLGFARLTAYVQCGHSYPNFYNQSPGVVAALLEAPRLPFEFRWVERRMVVTRSYAATPALQPGTEVLAIDGRPVAEILAALLPYSRADGANDGKRVSNLEVQGRGRYEAFDVYFPLAFPRPAARPFLLELRTAPGQPVRTVEVAAQAAAGERVVTEGAPRGDRNPWNFRDLAPGVVYLGMPTWAMYNSKFAWEAYLDGLFRELVADRTHDLVIDLRDNEGGSNVGDRLLAHLVSEPLPPRPIEFRTRYRKVPEDLVPYLDTWDRRFYDWGNAAAALGDGFYRLARDGDDRMLAPIAPRFEGRVWVLVGPVNSSATFEFAAAVQRLGLGTLVGQPTGGNQRGITGGAYFFLRLPGTGIEVDVPLIGQFPVSATPLPDAGLDPDILVMPTIEDAVGGRDVALEQLLVRIGRLAAPPGPPAASL